jgi:nuclear pore complex protein Nup93
MVVQMKQPYMVLLLALLAGDARAADAVTATLAQLQLPPVLATIEDYMWAKLTLLLASQVMSYTLWLH